MRAAASIETQCLKGGAAEPFDAAFVVFGGRCDQPGISDLKLACPRGMQLSAYAVLQRAVCRPP